MNTPKIGKSGKKDNNKRFIKGELKTVLICVKVQHESWKMSVFLNMFFAVSLFT